MAFTLGRHYRSALYGLRVLKLNSVTALCPPLSPKALWMLIMDFEIDFLCFIRQLKTKQNAIDKIMTMLVAVNL